MLWNPSLPKIWTLLMDISNKENYGLTNPPFFPLLASIKLDEDWAGLSMPLRSIPGVYPGGMGKAPGLCGGAFGPFLERFGTPGCPFAAVIAIAPRPKNSL